VIGIDKFGLSAPASDVIKAYGFDAQSLFEKVKEIVSK
jgi:transketolase